MEAPRFWTAGGSLLLHMDCASGRDVLPCRWIARGGPVTVLALTPCGTWALIACLLAAWFGIVWLMGRVMAFVRDRDKEWGRAVTAARKRRIDLERQQTEFMDEWYDKEDR